MKTELDKEDSTNSSTVTKQSDDKSLKVTYKGYETTINTETGTMTALVKSGHSSGEGNDVNKPTAYAGLSSTDGDAALPTGITEVAYENVQNENLKDTTKIKAVIKGTGTNNSDEVPIPIGAKYVTGTQNTGVVIEYKGSQFVWVPVPDAIYDSNSSKASKLPEGSVEGKGTVAGYAYTPMAIKVGSDYKGLLYIFHEEYGSGLRYFNETNFQGNEYEYREPAVVSDRGNNNEDYLGGINLTASTFAEEMRKNYNSMVTSVSKYGGFYIGRYETSYNTSTSNVQSVSGVKPMSSYDVSEQMWYGLYDKQKNFTTSEDKLQSSMIWGSQFDAMLNWVLKGTDSAHVTANDNASHEYESVQNTGAEGQDKINNIYDLEGNLWEMTLEAWGNNERAGRGGYYIGYTFSPGERTGGMEQDGARKYDGSRLSLYIK